MNLAEFLAYLADEPGWADAGEVGLMTRDSSGDTPLHAALWARDDEAARALVDAGANVNAVGEMSETPLHVAVRQENVDLAMYLSERGASWHMVGEFGVSPLDKARGSHDERLRSLAGRVG